MCIPVYVHAGACSCMWSPDDILRCHFQKYPRRQGLALAPSSPIRLGWLASKLQSPSLVLGALVPAIVLDTFFTWVLGSRLDPHACKTSALSIDLSWFLDLSFVDFLTMVQ